MSLVQIEYPKNIHLIRGNHESVWTNNIYGFLTECKERMVCLFTEYIFSLSLVNEVIILIVLYFQGEYGSQTCLKFNNVFNHLPLAALIGNKVLCMHGGIGRTLWLDEIASLQRPVSADYESKVLKDLLW